MPCSASGEGSSVAGGHSSHKHNGCGNGACDDDGDKNGNDDSRIL